jgi:COP9 signalosome complex subunit 7
MSSPLGLYIIADRKSIPYDTIFGAVQVESVRELEDLIIDVMYAGLLGGKMHHDERVLHVDWVSGRDVNPESLGDLVNGLQQWSVKTPIVLDSKLIDRCQTSRTLLTALEDQIAYLRNQNAQDASDRTAYNSARNVAFLNASKSDSQSGPNRQGSFQSLPTYDQVQAVGSKDSGRL